MKIAVTGSGGSIGFHLIPRLLDAGNEVTAVVRPGDDSSISGARVVPVDIVNGEGLEGALKGAEVLIHLAARNHVLKETGRDPLSAYRKVNVGGTRVVVRGAVRAGVRIIIHTSSVKAMGEGSEEILDEKIICKPSTPYGISKLESEKIVHEEASWCGCRAVIFRFPMVYGPRCRGNLPRLIRWAERGLPFPLFQPENLRSMVYVENVVAGMLASIEKAPEGISTYILKDPEDHSSRMVYSEICRELGKSPRFFPIPSALQRLGGVLSEDIRKVTGSYRVSSSKIEMELGFSSPVSFEKGIARTVEWYKRSAQ